MQPGRSAPGCDPTTKRLKLETVIEQQDLDFLRAFWGRRAVIAYSLFALNIIIFILMEFAGGSMNPPTTLAFGAKSNYEIDSGEFWRFITPIFLHIGPLHLAFNSYALWIVGPQVEKLYGASRFLLLYVLTGIAGVAASYWYHPLDPSAGASGAIFGLFGVLLVFSFRYRKTIPSFFSKALGKGILLTVGINLVIGWMIPQVDNSAHLGGLIAGALLAAVVPFQRPGEIPGKKSAALQAGLVLLIGLSFFEVLAHYDGPALSFRNLLGRFNRSSAPSVDFMFANRNAQQAFSTSEEILELDNLRRVPDVRKDLSDAIVLLQHVPSVSRSADNLNGELLDILQKQYAYLGEVERSGKERSDFIGASPQSSQFERWKIKFEKWRDRESAK
jgi:membrane associated rhomboid family serine protease